MIKLYYNLTKPGMIYGNVLLVVAGFFVASRGSIDIATFLSVTIGMSLVVASACVYNNYIDRDIDGLMARTKDRELVKAVIPPTSALKFASSLLILGVLALYAHTNVLTIAVAFLGFFTYVYAYSYSKRVTVFSTHIGAVAGAMPPVAGYAAVTGVLDKGALALFAILFFWQMVHFFAIAIYRLDEYRAAKIPIMPARIGTYQTKLQIVMFACAFAVLSPVPTQIGLTGYLYGIVMTIMSLLWLVYALWGFWASDEKKWARRMFFYSLFVIFSVAILLIINWRGSLL